MCCELGVNDIEQYQICEKIFNGIDEKFKVSNHRIEDLENKTVEINNINNVLVELQLLTKLQREDSIKRDKSIDEMNKTQIEITNTLRTLAENLNKTDINVDKLSKKIDMNNEEVNKKFDDINKDNNINVPQLIKKGVEWLIVASLGIGGTYLVLVSKGLIQ